MRNIELSSKCKQWLCALALTGGLLQLCACSKSEPPPPPKAEDTVFGDMVKAKERAKEETEKAMKERDQHLDEALNKAEGDDNATQ